MENASKALIIAGAVLISILIIGLGVFLYQQAQGTVNKANLNTQEAQTQNSQFTGFFGTSVSAATVKQLCSTVRANNIAGKTSEDENKKVYLLYSESKDDKGKFMAPTYLSKKVKAGSTYRVETDNDKASDYTKDTDQESASPSGGTEDEIDPTDDDLKTYWKSGYIKVIHITKRVNGDEG